MEKIQGLDLKDKKLLYELDLDARLGTSALGKKIELSQEGVHYRLQRLEKKGIISGYMTFLNFGKLGYTGYAVYARFQNITVSKKQNIIEKLKKNNKIYWIAEFGGKYDLAFAIMARNIIEFNEIYIEISSKYHNNLKDFTIAIRAELIQFPRNYILDKKTSGKAPKFGKYIENEELDKIDKAILKEISRDPRLSLLEISERTKSSPNTVKSHLKNLTEKEIIQGYGAKIQCQEYGYEKYQFFVSAHNLTKENKTKLISYCQNNPNIIFYIETVGKWNFEIVYEIENQKKLPDLIIELRTKFSDIILDVESIVLFDHYVKYNQYPI